MGVLLENAERQGQRNAMAHAPGVNTLALSANGGARTAFHNNPTDQSKKKNETKHEITRVLASGESAARGGGTKARRWYKRVAKESRHRVAVARDQGTSRVEGVESWHGPRLQALELDGLRAGSHRSRSGQLTSRCRVPGPHLTEHLDHSDVCHCTHGSMLHGDFSGGFRCCGVWRRQDFWGTSFCVTLSTHFTRRCRSPPPHRREHLDHLEARQA